MTSSETRALTHAALLVLGLGLVRVAAESVRSPVTPRGAVPDSSGLAVLLEESRESRDGAERRSTPLTNGEKIDPNTATEEQLDRLPGVGPAVAGRIVQMRLDRGRFAQVSDLLSVPGVGPATLARITPYIELPNRSGVDGSTRTSRIGRTRLRSVDPDRLDLNRATREELEQLPGVGPVTGERILTLRRSLGKFRVLEELRSVRGIGSASIERLRPLLVIGR